MTPTKTASEKKRKRESAETALASGLVGPRRHLFRIGFSLQWRLGRQLP